MIVTTTPTGDIGGKLLDILLDRATEPLRVIARDPAKLSDDVRDRVDVVTGSHGDAAVVDRAFDGADAVFWLIPPSPGDTVQDAYVGFSQPAAEAVAAHGVGHVVGVSALGRGTPVADRAGLVTVSLEVDDMFGRSGASYRALALAGFYENVLRQVASIRDEGRYAGTATPDRPYPLVATDDIAARAADLLLDRSWTGVAETPLLGPENLTSEDLVRIMSEVLGRPVRYEPMSLDALAAATRSYAGESFAQGMVDMMWAKENGLDDGVARTAETSSPTTFRQWCERVLQPAVSR